MSELVEKDFWNCVFEQAITCPIDDIVDWINKYIDNCPDRVFRSTWSRASDDYKKVVVKSIMRDVASVICHEHMIQYNVEIIKYANNE